MYVSRGNQYLTCKISLQPKENIEPKPEAFVRLPTDHKHTSETYALWLSKFLPCFEYFIHPCCLSSLYLMHYFPSNFLQKSQTAGKDRSAYSSRVSYIFAFYIFAISLLANVFIGEYEPLRLHTLASSICERCRCTGPREEISDDIERLSSSLASARRWWYRETRGKTLSSVWNLIIRLVNSRPTCRHDSDSILPISFVSFLHRVRFRLPVSLTRSSRFARIVHATSRRWGAFSRCSPKIMLNIAWSIRGLLEKRGVNGYR